MTVLAPLSLLTLLPLLGGVVLLGLGEGRARFVRWFALGWSVLLLALVLALWFKFKPGSGLMQFEQECQWIPTLGIRYHVGIDGLGLLLVLLSAVLVPMSIVAAWQIRDRVPLYFALVFFLQSGLFGTFTALNFVHWFLFWELSLIPAFFLIRLWGGARAGAAALQFFVYTMAGSVALLLAFLAIALSTHEFDFLKLAEMGRNGTLGQVLADQLGWRNLTGRQLGLVIFGFAFLGFAVKVPMVPFHTWLPLTYAEAPTGTTMLLTGAMSKMGLYGFLRVLLPIFPEQLRWTLNPLLGLAVLTILYGAWTALAQTDLKRILAYSSINHLGYCLLGVFAVLRSSTNPALMANEKAAVLDGVFLQMLNHGITAAALFWFAGLLERRSGGARLLSDFGGLRAVMPVFCGLMGIALFSSLGLPGLNGFVGEFLIFKGVFAVAPWGAVLALPGLLVTAIFLLNLLQKVFYGPLNPRLSACPDLNWAERLSFAPVIAVMLVLGIYPQCVLRVINSSVVEIARHLRF